jgi:hypothetical protein
VARKIIASDYDCTLKHGDEISRRDKDAIKAWRGAGNLFGIATGRSRDFLETIAEDGVETDFLIVYNGAEVYGPGGELIKRFTGKTDKLYDMASLVLRGGSEWAEVVASSKNYFVTYNDKPAARDNWAKTEILKSIDEFVQIYALYGSEEESLETARLLAENFGGCVSPMVNGCWLNAAPVGITKSSGIWEYAGLRAVDKEHIFTIGDTYNDLDMIRTFNGFCVENGAADVKKAARAVCAGVWELIENFM